MIFGNNNQIKLSVPFRLAAAGGPVSPVVFSDPHSGTVFPEHFSWSGDPLDHLNMGDPHIDWLLQDVPATGTPVLHANIVRTCIDLNRSEREVGNDTISGLWPHPRESNGNTKLGFGLFFRYLIPPGSSIIKELRTRKVPEAQACIAHYHRPFHARLGELIGQAQDAHGYSIHADIHSMRRRPDCNADIVIGSLHGRACGREEVDLASSFFASAGLRISVDSPYAGQYILKRHGAPASSRHSLQIEILRDLYLHGDRLTLKRDAAAIRHLMTGFSRTLQDYATEKAPFVKASPRCAAE